MLVSNNKILKDNNIVNIFLNNNKLLFQTKELGFFTERNDKSIVEWDIKLNKKLKEYSVYNSLQLQNNELYTRYCF